MLPLPGRRASRPEPDAKRGRTATAVQVLGLALVAVGLGLLAPWLGVLAAGAGLTAIGVAMALD